MKIYSKLLFLAVAVCIGNLLHANSPIKTNSCNCNYTIASATTIFDASAVKPGEVICIDGGTRKELQFKNISGTTEKPIIVQNCNSKVTIKSEANYGILFKNSKHFHLSGKGSSDTYGIYIQETDLMGITVTGFSTDFEINNIEISNVGFAGIIAKTDPVCGQEDLRHFVMKNVILHHNYIHDVAGEGIYLGYSWYPSRTIDCSGNSTTLYPHKVTDVDIHHNIVERTGWDGIQVGSAIANIKVHHNTIDNYGLEKISSQDNGMQIGVGSTGDWYNNKITNGQGSGGNGIINIGQGNSTIFNNIITNTKGNGIYVNDKGYNSDQAYYRAFNNTIVAPGLDGIFFSMKFTSNSKNMIANNIVCNPGRKYFSFHSSYVSGSNNSEISDLTQVKFVNDAAGDYRLQEGSPEINTGSDLSAYGVTFDFNDNVRDTKIDAYDRGAFEYSPFANSNVSTSTAQALRVFPNPVKHFFSIEGLTQKTDIELLSISGQSVLRKTVYPSQNKIDVSTLEQGIYLIRVPSLNCIVKLAKH